MNYIQSQDSNRFEFLLTLENNIIIQRFFNVRDYNPDAKHSLLLHYCVENICNDIQHDLKIKSMEYVCEDQNNFFEEEEDDTKVVMDPEENFLIEIKMDNEILLKRIFPAHIYHPKARYAVDIRPKVKDILGSLIEVLSSKKQVKKYLNYTL